MLRLHVFEDSILIQPSRGNNGQNYWGKKNLNINRRTGEITEVPDQLVDLRQASSSAIYLVVGIVRLLSSQYLIVATDAKIVWQIGESSVYQITAYEILPFDVSKSKVNAIPEDEARDEEKYLDMIYSVLNHGVFYFSYDYHLTQNSQAIAEIEKDAKRSSLPLWKLADDRFFWNRHLSKELISQGLDNWILPIMDGFVETAQCHHNGNKFEMTLISRRSCKRVGTRFTCRGIDEQGNVANFVETEQIIAMKEDDDDIQLLSFVLTRGSVPLVWKQPPTLKWMPPIELDEGQQTSKSFQKHFDEQISEYGRQVCVCLINHKGKELSLERGFHREVEESDNPKVRFVSFDFHHECRRMQYQNLDKLVEEVIDEFDTMHYFCGKRSVEDAADMKVDQSQESVFRVNCLDNLDRSNVVQSLFARRMLAMQFHDLKWDTKLSLEFDSEFEYIYKNIWADNADAMSIQYAGTPALKTDFTRTGKRTASGALQDGKNAIERYIRNNFFDGQRQDAYNLFLGDFVPQKGQVSPLAKKQQSVVHAIGKIGLFIFVGLFLLTTFTPLKTSYPTFFMLFFLMMILQYFFVVIPRGKDYADIPKTSGSKSKTE